MLTSELPLSSPYNYFLDQLVWNGDRVWPPAHKSHPLPTSVLWPGLGEDTEAGSLIHLSPSLPLAGKVHSRGPGVGEVVEPLLLKWLLSCLEVLNSVVSSSFKSYKWAVSVFSTAHRPQLYTLELDSEPFITFSVYIELKKKKWSDKKGVDNNPELLN